MIFLARTKLCPKSLQYTNTSQPQVLEYDPDVWIEVGKLGGGGRGFHSVVSVGREDLPCICPGSSLKPNC